MSDVTWFGGLLIGLWSLGAIATILRIGKPRDPLSHADAVTQLVLAVLLAVGVLTIGTNR